MKIESNPQPTPALERARKKARRAIRITGIRSSLEIEGIVVSGDQVRKQVDNDERTLHVKNGK